MIERFWKRLTLFAYRRWAASVLNDVGDAQGLKPVGVPGNRDPLHPCTSYAPRTRKLEDWHDCRTDGHYLCRECCHRDDNPPDRPGWIQVSTYRERSN